MQNSILYIDTFQRCYISAEAIYCTLFLIGHTAVGYSPLFYVLLLIAIYRSISPLNVLLVEDGLS